ncbi:hypothetical protein KC957_00420, partial [Candidatus Saccharibacteria bacterium]|nr:hypothetical protein [Candidatus Saccharibacteria bacterium]
MKATTPDAQMPNQLQHVLDIVNGSVTVLESAQQLSELTLGSAVLHGQEISVELVSQLEDAAQRLSTVSQGLLHVAGIATENIPTEPTTDGADRAVERIDVEGSEEPSTALAMDTDLVEQPLEQTKGTSDTPGDGVSGRTMKTPTREKEAKKEPTTGEAKPVKPRYNERELAVVERIASSIETGKWFRQREINIDDLEKDGLQFKDEQKRRSFFSSVLGKLADDGVLTHNGKLRGGSQHMIERPELIAQVVEEGTSFKGSDAAMRHRPQIHKAVKDTSTQPDPAPRREK